MPKIVLGDVATGAKGVDAINSNNTILVEASDNLFFRNGTTPNTMLANLDMNGFSILNIGNPPEYVVLETFTEDGIWTKDPDAKMQFVCAIGGGGGGCGGAKSSNNNHGGGGGGGGISEKWFNTSSLPDTVNVIVGVGGGGSLGAFGGGQSGPILDAEAGTASLFGDFLSAGGGVKGINSGAPEIGGAGILSYGGDSNYATFITHVTTEFGAPRGGWGGEGTSPIVDAVAGFSSSTLHGGYYAGGTVGTSGATATAGGNGTDSTIAGLFGTGGGGGGYCTDNAGYGGAGGNGGFPGAGGGGGGSGGGILAPGGGGNAGRGANGVVWVWTFY